MKRIYANHPDDKRPGWIVRPDGTDAQHVEVTRFRFGGEINGRRAQQKPTAK